MNRMKRSAWVLAAGCLAAAALAGPVARAQSPESMLTSEQLEILRSLPPDQRDALIDQLLGSRQDGLARRDRQLQFPETVIPRDPDAAALEQEGLFGEPRFKADDTLLLLLEIREFEGPDPVLPAPPATAAPGEQAAPPVQPPPPQRQRIIRTPDELAELKELRERIQGRNPYRLNRLGRLEIPELGQIALAGLTEAQAQRRLSVATELADFTIEVIRLPLERTGEEALKPFGYDLFAGIPTTFAPATDIPVPADYVIGPGDQIRVQLYGDLNQSYVLTVGRDGLVNFPELGPIDVSGQTFSQLRADLEQRVARQMIGTQASITVGETRSIRVFVLGEAYRSGSYTVSGLSTITNALFVSGGVTEIGSLRNIQLKRRGTLVSRLDLYDLLLHGDTSDDSRLLPGDVIFIPPVGKTVAVTGEVRRPAIYEVAGETTARQLIELAGGLAPEADPSLVRLERINDQRQRVTLDVDLSREVAPATALVSGDVLRVMSIRTGLENSVLLQGHVHRPGALQYRPGMRLSDAIPSLDELKPRADMHYVLVRRELPPDRLVTAHSADLARALASRGSEADILLQPRDRIIVFDSETGRDRILAPLFDELRLQSRLDRPMQIVGVGGRVKAPGRYPLEPGMRVSDLIRAGASLQEAAYGGEAELTRHRIVDGEYRQIDLVLVDLGAVLRGDTAADIVLESYDYLNVKEMPQWSRAESVEIVGEVRFPGTYPVKRGETLRSVMQRAGGITDLAFPEGSIFLREDLRQKEQERIEQLAVRLQSDIAVLALQASQENTRATQALTVGQSLLSDLQNAKPVGRLVFDLKQVMASDAGSAWDVVMKDGDRIMVPRRAQEVTVLGEVQTTTSHLYRPDLSRDDYISLSGGTTQKADERRTYVVRADGSVVTSGSQWFGRSVAEIRPGDSIVVPLDAERMRPLPLWIAVTQIIYQMAIAAAAVNSF
ncbi:MAG: SLBB domain-containing protein [Steroidobacteraceae bacterium]